MSEVLVASGLGKQYGETPSVDGVSFTIGRGDVVGLLGANGAGKSTLMNMLTGCIPPSCGTVSVCSHDMQAAPRDAKRHIGYLPEIPPLYLDMQVREQLAFAADLRSVPKAARQAEIDRVCILADISDVRPRLIRQLSKGYRQRVGLAQALIASPPLLILDEPTAGLDPKQIMDFRALIATLARQHTILISSHILAEITSVCTRLFVMRKGHLVADSTPAQLGDAHDGGQQLSLRLKGNQELIRSTLAGVGGVQLIELSASVEAGCWDASVSVDAHVDPRATISMALAHAGCPVLMMRPAKATLEDVFMRLAA
jgi:ABC-2 type transport system ATP-binding protein